MTTLQCAGAAAYVHRRKLYLALNEEGPWRHSPDACDEELPEMFRPEEAAPFPSDDEIFKRLVPARCDPPTPYALSAPAGPQEPLPSPGLDVAALERGLDAVAASPRSLGGLEDLSVPLSPLSGMPSLDDYLSTAARRGPEGSPLKPPSPPTVVPEAPKPRVVVKMLEVARAKEPRGAGTKASGRKRKAAYS